MRESAAIEKVEELLALPGQGLRQQFTVKSFWKPSDK
jgi:hypothetical protein